jgi:hypothetical protein
MKLAFVLLFALSATAQQTRTDLSAFAQISSERNPEVKKKLALNFEKSFPKSKYLAEVYIQLSRVLVSQTDLSTAKQYAEKAVTAVRGMKSSPPENADNAWHGWVNTLESSAQSNLAWVNQMAAWQQQQINSAVAGRHK